MLKQVDKCRHVAKIKTARYEYEKHVFQSKKIAARLEELIDEKKLYSEPVVRKNVIVLNRLESIERNIYILRTEHYFAIDRVLLSRDYFIQTQSETLEDMEINPQKYLPRKRKRKK